MVKKINWAEVGVSAASGALTGAIIAACPSMGAVATGLDHGAIGPAYYFADLTYLNSVLR